MICKPVPLHKNPVLASIGASETIESRFWDKVIKTETCWLWIGAVSGKGYGHLGLGSRASKKIKAHIFSWILANNILPPDGNEVCHNCPGGDRYLCVNPSHLWTGTHQDNMDDRGIKRGTPKQPNQHRDGFGNKIRKETAQ